MVWSTATYLFLCTVPLAQLRVFNAKVSEEFHAWQIKQEATVLKVDKHKYLKARSEHIGSILQKQNVVCDAEKELNFVILIKNTFFFSIAEIVHLKADPLFPKCPLSVVPPEHSGGDGKSPLELSSSQCSWKPDSRQLPVGALLGRSEARSSQNKWCYWH